MTLLNYNIVKFLILLIIGICIAHYSNPNFFISVLSTITSTILLGISWLCQKNKVSKTLYFSLLTYLCFLCLGAFTYHIHKDNNKSSYYDNFLDNSTNVEFVLRISERLKPNAYYHKYVANVVQLGKQKVSGKLLLNIKKDSLFHGFSIDDVILTKEKPLDVKAPTNPYQFDYSAYLKLKQIQHQITLSYTKIKILDTKTHSIYGYADVFRQHINKRLQQHGFNTETMSIINALLLGQRQDISPKIYNNYVNSGTIHILAVSGLHVGIILWILNFLFKPLLRLKYGRIIRPFLIVVLLWLFAIIAGLSPSVTRSVSMFSVIAIALHFKRTTNIYNTLAISAFCILLFKPTFLFEVGFQMSYLAVIGIVSIQPLLYNLITTKLYIINNVWQIFTVTIAAQLGVLPISLFYFHQFPGLFFVSNIVVIPFLGLILSLGLLVIIAAALDILYPFIVNTYSFIIECLNTFISWVAQFESFLIKDIPFSLLDVLLCYGIIICTTQFIIFKKAKWLIITCIVIIGFQSNSIYNGYKTTHEALIIFNKIRHTIIGKKMNKHLFVYHNLDSLQLKNDNIIRNYKVGESIKNLEYKPLVNYYTIKHKSLLVVDSLGVYENLSFKPTYILLQNSPRINLSRLIDSLQPQMIIADASNYRSYVTRWKANCTKKNTLFHYTYEKGAFVLK